jgi:hypothetical protein
MAGVTVYKCQKVCRSRVILKKIVTLRSDKLS